MSNMKVAYLTASSKKFYGGGWIRDVILVNALKNQGTDISLYSAFYPPFTDEKLPPHEVVFSAKDIFLTHALPFYKDMPRLENRYISSISKALQQKVIDKLNLPAGGLNISKIQDRLEKEILESILLGKKGLYKKEIERLERQFSRCNPGIINSGAILWSAVINDIKSATPHVSTIQGWDMLINTYDEDTKNHFLDLIRERIGETDAIIGISKYYIEHSRKVLKIPRKKMHLVYNGITLANKEERKPQKKSGTFVIGFIGRFVPTKGLDQLILAVKHLADEGYTGVKVKIAGNTSLPGDTYMKTVKSQINMFNLKNIEILGRISKEEKLRMVRSCDIFVYSTAYPEPFGLVPIEVMAEGTPVILPAHGAFPEIHKETGGCLLYRPNDPYDLSRKIIHLIENPDEKEALGKKGQENVFKKFSSETMAKNVLEVYEKVASCR